jgi:N-acetylneuraminic acid mutarotase
VAKYPDLFGGAKNGFTHATFVFDPRHEASGWTRIGNIPGPRRQAAAAAVAGGALYAIGGFNYDAPYTCQSVYRLKPGPGDGRWEDVSAELPWPVCEAAAGVIGRVIYLIRGADFCPQPGHPDCDFNIAGRRGQPVGRAILSLDTANPRSGWRQVTQIPGTPRFDTCATVAAGKIYVFSGVHREPLPLPGGYSNVVDAWSSAAATSRWERLADLPHRSNQHALTRRSRNQIGWGQEDEESGVRSQNALAAAKRPGGPILSEGPPGPHEYSLAKPCRENFPPERDSISS